MTVRVDKAALGDGFQSAFVPETEARVLLLLERCEKAAEIVSCIRYAGFVVRCCDVKKEAIHTAIQCSPDIIVASVTVENSYMDIVKELLQHYDVPVIFIADSDEEELFLRAKELNVFAWLVEPVSLSTLPRMLQVALAKQGNERRMRENESRYRQLIEVMTEGVVVIDSDYRILFANMRFVSMCRENHELYGEELSKYLPSLDLSCAECVFSRVPHPMMAEPQLVMQSLLVSSSGSNIPVRISMTPFDSPYLQPCSSSEGSPYLSYAGGPFGSAIPKEGAAVCGF